MESPLCAGCILAISSSVNIAVICRNNFAISAPMYVQIWNLSKSLWMNGIEEKTEETKVTFLGAQHQITRFGR